MSKLFLVGTPIGNLGDISPRAAATLAEVDFIAAEDTRVSIKLLNHLGIHKPMISYHEHNRVEMGNKIVDRIIHGENCAIITDAGMPCISDPGEELVRLCGESGVETVVIPGPSALISAIALSGLATGRFCFEGFLSMQKSSRFKHLDSLIHDERTLVFYEAPHKLIATLKDMFEYFGDRKITLGRELTKMHEEVIRTTLSQAIIYFCEEAHKPRGEFVLVIQGAQPKTEDRPSFEQAVEMIKSLQSSGISAAQAAKEVAKETGHKKRELYSAYLLS